MTTGEKISLLRRKKGITQEQLAEMLLVSRQSVSKWEKDITFPETDKLILLSKLFACSIDFLLNNNDHEEDIQPCPSVEECYRFIRDCGYFFLATSVNDYPRLRPFGMIYSDGHALFFTTDKRKNVYSELVGNPQVEIAAYNLHTRKWVRIGGRAKPESSTHIREGISFVYPALKQKYQDGAEIYLAIFKLIADEISIT